MGKIDHVRNPDAIPLLRTVVEAEIERLIGLLDALDGDPDLEPDVEGEPWLASFGAYGDPGDDREIDEQEAA